MNDYLKIIVLMLFMCGLAVFVIYHNEDDIKEREVIIEKEGCVEVKINNVFKGNYKEFEVQCDDVNFTFTLDVCKEHQFYFK